MYHYKLNSFNNLKGAAAKTFTTYFLLILHTSCNFSPLFKQPSATLATENSDASSIKYIDQFSDMPMRIYCGESKENFKPSIFLQKIIRSSMDPFYQKDLKSGYYRLFRNKSLQDPAYSIQKKGEESLTHNDEWTFWRDDLEIIYNRTPGHESFSFRQVNGNLILLIPQVKHTDPKSPSNSISLAEDPLLRGYFGSERKNITCKEELITFAAKAPDLDEMLVVETVAKDGTLKKITMPVDILALQSKVIWAKRSEIAVAAGLILPDKKTVCDPKDIMQNQLIGSHVFDQRGTFVGHLFEFSPGDGANTRIQLVNDNQFGVFYANGQSTQGWTPNPAKFLPGKKNMMSSSFMDYKDYINSQEFAKKSERLSPAELASLKLITAVKKLNLYRKPK